MRWLDGIINSMDMSFSKFWEAVGTGEAGVLQSIGSQRHDLVTELVTCILLKIFESTQHNKSL